MSILLRLPPPCRRRGFTLLELLVVLVLLGLGAAVVLPTLALPARGGDASDGPLTRARATAVRRGESVRLTIAGTGDWSARAAADTTGTILISGTTSPVDAGAARIIVITALGTCLPEDGTLPGVIAWDPARCAVARH